MEGHIWVISGHKARNLWNKQKQNIMVWILEYEQHNDQHIKNSIVLSAATNPYAYDEVCSYPS